MTNAANLAASAANINSSGKVSVSGINATGTPSSSTFLRGDGSWQTAGGDPTTTQVLNATAGLTLGAVGSYGFLLKTSSGTVEANATVAGSSLSWTNASGNSSGNPSGTWRILGRSEGGVGGNSCCSMYVRIS